MLNTGSKMKILAIIITSFFLFACGEGTQKGPIKTSCGDGIVSGSEICDPAITSGAGACPTTCQSTTSCSTSLLVGSAQGCDARCEPAVISQCIEGDGCCPAECGEESDSDCSKTCGDGVVDEGETCDGNCESCDDGDSCTSDLSSGSAKNCSLECTHDAITNCTDADGCCPANCDESNDSDCSDSCGDGIVVAGEVCDGNCPTSCEDQDACTIDSLSGRPDLCNVVCINTPFTECKNDDGCCAAGCNFANDNDCSCTPKTCATNACGSIDDGCGSTVNCGGCANGKACENNVCVLSVKEDVGGACADPTGCVGASCITTPDFGGGFCTDVCTDDFGCPQGTHCIDMPGYASKFCSPHCQADNDCRPGGVYGCWDVDGDGNKECAPKPTGNSQVGGACNGLSDCDDWSNRCLSGSPGGYCFAPCILNFDCPGTTVCLNATQGNGHCAQRCEQTSDCRSGYDCQVSTNNITGEMIGVCN